MTWMTSSKPILTCAIDDYDLEGYLRVAAAFGQERFGYVVTPNADHLIRLHEEPEFAALYADACHVLLDSRFLSYLFRLTKGVRAGVCTGSDLTQRLLADVIRPEDKIVLIGGSEAQAREVSGRFGLRNLQHFNPAMGFIHDAQAVVTTLQFIERHSPFRFCLLALGSPQQEMLACQLKTRGIARGLALCVGASINFLTGVERRAPQWMQRLGAEWLYRLLQNPQRLGRRYLIRGPRVFWLLRHTRIEMRPGVALSAPAAALPGTGAR